MHVEAPGNVCLDWSETVGQTIGGMAFGLGQIMSEQVVYDESGQPAGSIVLGLRTPARGLDARHGPGPHPNAQSADPAWPKGGAEGANIALPAAVWNSVLDALAPLGVSQVAMPLRSESVWRAVRAARRADHAMA